MMKHKVDWGPGWRFFKCDECGNTWRDMSRDCTSNSVDCCPECNECSSPYGNEPHFEWPTDKNGNLAFSKNDDINLFLKALPKSVLKNSGDK